MSYLYESHLGGFYSSDYFLDDDLLYCEECGDSDWLIGSYETAYDFFSLIKDDCDINGSGGYSLPYVYSQMLYEFEIPYEVMYKDDERISYYDLNENEILNKIYKLIDNNKT